MYTLNLKLRMQSHVILTQDVLQKKKKKNTWNIKLAAAQLLIS